MFYKTELYKVEEHPFPPFIPEGTRTLILGTFPTHKKNYQFPFYYSGKDNLFWEIISKVFNHNFKYKEGEIAVTERKQFLTEKKIGITDMLKKCYRYDEKSGDEHLFPIILNDVVGFLGSQTSIERLVFTSRTPINGAWGLFQTLAHQTSLAFDQPSKNGKMLQGTLTLNGKRYINFIPYSPSPRTIKEGRITKGELIDMYKKSLL
jgi:hypoxanthine-DNA glycosylase